VSVVQAFAAPRETSGRPFRRLCLSLALLLGLATTAGASPPAGGLSLYGQPKYADGFAHFDYVNPDAPKGGELRLAQVGGFDSLSPLAGLSPTARGTEARPIDLLGLTFDRLLARSADEPASGYGLVAETIEIAPDGHWVVFNLRPQARFHDGSPITAADIGFSFDTFTALGPPEWRSALAGIARAEPLADRKIRFVAPGGDAKAQALIVGTMPILSRADWHGRDPAEPRADAPMGSGPYVIASAQIGQSLVLSRVSDYWAKDLPVVRGQFNFERIRVTFFADPGAAFAAFVAGDTDIRYEYESKKWATAYRIPAVTRGRMIRRTLPARLLEPMRGFAVNVRRAPWQDRRVRRALVLAFDFDSLNRQFFFGQYVRSLSYFANSDWAAQGPPDDDERRLLEPFRDHLPAEALTAPFVLPTTTTPAERRQALAEAAHLLDQAGWTRSGGHRHRPTGQTAPIIDIVVDSPGWEPLCRPFVKSLHRLGLDARITTVSPSIFAERLARFDFDLAPVRWPPITWPGADLAAMFGSAAADLPGGLNWPGIKDPGIDAMIGAMTQAGDSRQVTHAARALDRLLLWGDYVIPQWHMAQDHVAFWNRFAMPANSSDAGMQVMTWWMAPSPPEDNPPPAPRHRAHRVR
jgi:microcin C transport system substrate-binding protein